MNIHALYEYSVIVSLFRITVISAGFCSYGRVIAIGSPIKTMLYVHVGIPHQREKTLEW